MNFALVKIERACILEYQLQTYLIEIVQIKRPYRNFDKLIENVLIDLKSNCKFWLEGSDVWNDITENNQGLDLELQKNQNVDLNKTLNLLPENLGQNLNDDNLLKKKNFLIIRDAISVNDSPVLEKTVEKIIKVEVKHENFTNSYVSHSPITSIENQK